MELRSSARQQLPGIIKDYPLRSNFAESFGSGSNDGGNTYGFINCTLPLRYNSTTEILSVDAATPTMGGTIITGSQSLPGSKTFVQSVYPALSITDLTTTATMGVSTVPPAILFGGPPSFDLTTMHPRNDDCGEFEKYFTNDCLKPGGTYATGFVVASTGVHTFSVSSGTLTTCDASNALTAKTVLTYQAFPSQTDLFESFPMTYVYIDSTIADPSLAVTQSTEDTSFADLTTNGRALIAIIYKMNSGNRNISSVVGLTRMSNSDCMARVIQSMYLASAQITHMDEPYYNNTFMNPVVENLTMFTPFIGANPLRSISAITDWYLVCGIDNPDRPYYMGPTSVEAYYISDSWDGYTSTIAPIPDLAVGVILLGYDPIASRAWWMPSQMILVNSSSSIQLFKELYIQKCTKYPTLEHSLLLAYAIPNGDTKMSGATYYKWYGRQPFGSL